MPGAVSNPTRRVIAVLDLLARRPLHAFSLTDVSRDLGISKSTLHPLIETLVEAGYLLRDPSTKQLRLGPVLTGLGAAALGGRGHTIDVLRPTMERIAKKLDAHCIVSADVAGWIVPLASAGEPSRITTLFRVGARSNPFVAPIGVLFLPGRPMSEIQEWLERAESRAAPAEVEVALAALDFLRSSGFAAAARIEVKARMEQALDGYATEAKAANSKVVRDLVREIRHTRYLLTDFTDSKSTEVDWIGVPMLDEAGRVDAALVVVNLPRPLIGSEIPKIAQMMRKSVTGLPGIRLLET